MKYLVLCFTFNLLFFINTVYSELKIDGPETIPFEKKQPIKLVFSVNNTDGKNLTVKWKKGDEIVSNIDDLKNRIKIENSSNQFTLTINNPTEKDTGNYSFAVSNGNGDISKTIQVTSKVLVKVQTNINVVEGEKLRIHCQVAGSPPPTLHWTFTPDGTTNTTVIEDEGRFKLEEDEHKIENSILILENIEMSDRGVFKCIGKSSTEEDSSSCMVRIKDKYAALWPFLGIVAEVVILCAIIFIYEKKHNKAELDESDTDQSPDQKNTPDHGKDSNLRHRQ